MIDEIRRHPAHYFILFVMLFMSLAIFTIFSYNRVVQKSVIVALGVGYILWGVLHHFIHGDLTRRVLVEYILFAAFGVTLVLALILRA